MAFNCEFVTVLSALFDNPGNIFSFLLKRLWLLLLLRVTFFIIINRLQLVIDSNHILHNTLQLSLTFSDFLQLGFIRQRIVDYYRTNAITTFDIFLSSEEL